MTDFSAKSDVQIDQWIKNHEDRQATNLPLYAELLEERARRGQEKSSLLVDTSIALLRTAAIEQRCVSYGDLAAESGVAWSRARHRMNGPGGHLDQLLDVCHARKLPMLPALCVNQGGIRTGELEENALRGFATGARRLGFAVGPAVHEERAFHHQRRDECWSWGRSVKDR
jgi:hypothetical protein